SDNAVYICGWQDITETRDLINALEVEKNNAIKIANEKMAKGDKKGAMEELRLAGVGVMENQYLMPLKQTRNALADAQKLLDKKQYYEANLALKGAEDGIIVDSEALFVN
ncbi:YfdX family protein, partial [Escherichia coli]|uniref:YfdX family protein n=1 Tax=Escherichia coli TaxID=562 RepID=UPI002034FE6C